MIYTMTVRLAFLALAVTMAGCSLTPEYGCRAPDGVTCMSASEVYDRDGRGETIRPKIKKEDGDDENEKEKLPPPPKGFTGPVARKPGDPIFREPHRMRVWVVDWEDTNKVYHPNHYLYLLVDNGQWVMPVMRERLLEEEEDAQ